MAHAVIGLAAVVGLTALAAHFIIRTDASVRSGAGMGHSTGTKAQRVHKPAAEREAEILEAAAILFARQGYRSVEVQEIADRAGAGKGTVYRFFPTKEELFLGALRRRLDRLHDDVNRASCPVSDPLEKIRAATHAYLRFFDEHPETVELFIQERAELRDREMSLYFLQVEAHQPDWVGVFQALIDDGRMRRMDVHVAMETLGHLLYGFVLSERRGARGESLVQRFDDMFETYFYGVLGPGTGLSRNS